MTFQYAHHRPMTPITPSHSPHPSGGSSVRTRTPGQLSLHEYRKMQVTPSPPAIPGQKTVKKKRGLTSLTHTESLSAVLPEAPLYQSFQTLSTPPLTPSLDPPMDFTSHSLPPNAPRLARALQAAVGPTYPEFYHLNSFERQPQQHSPPTSPSLPSFSSPSNLLLSSTSPYQPPTPRCPDTPVTLSSRPQEHAQARQRSLNGSLSDRWFQKSKYVSLNSEVKHSALQHNLLAIQGVQRSRSARDLSPRVKQEVKSTNRPSTSDFSQASQQLDLPFPGLRIKDELPGLFPTLEPRFAQDVSRSDIVGSSRNSLRRPALQIETTSSAESEVAGHLPEEVEPRERYFNPIKHLPRPDVSLKGRAAGPALTPSSNHSVYQSDNTTSTSTFSLSKFPFPKPPPNLPFAQSLLRYSAPITSTTVEDQKLAIVAPPFVRYSDTFFDLPHSHDSLPRSNILEPPEVDDDSESDSELFSSPSDHLLQDKDEPRDTMAFRGRKPEDRSGTQTPPARREFGDLATAHRTILNNPFNVSTSSRTQLEAEGGASRSPVTPITPQHVTEPWDFNAVGERISRVDGSVLSSSVDAGPAASVSDSPRSPARSLRASPGQTAESQNSTPPSPLALRRIPQATFTTTPPALEPLAQPDQNSNPNPRRSASHRPSPINIEAADRPRPLFSRDPDYDYHAAVYGHASATAHFSTSYGDAGPSGEQQGQQRVAHFATEYSGLRRLDPDSLTTGRAGRDIASYYENTFESESVAGAEEDSYPHGRVYGNTRYSTASTDFTAHTSWHRQSELFPYQQYESPRTQPTDTLSGIIRGYAEETGAPERVETRGQVHFADFITPESSDASHNRESMQPRASMQASEGLPDIEDKLQQARGRAIDRYDHTGDLSSQARRGERSLPRHHEQSELEVSEWEDEVSPHSESIPNPFGGDERAYEGDDEQPIQHHQGPVQRMSSDFFAAHGHPLRSNPTAHIAHDAELLTEPLSPLEEWENRDYLDLSRLTTWEEYLEAYYELVDIPLLSGGRWLSERIHRIFDLVQVRFGSAAEAEFRIQVHEPPRRDLDEESSSETEEEDPEEEQETAQAAALALENGFEDSEGSIGGYIEQLPHSPLDAGPLRSTGHLQGQSGPPPRGAPPLLPGSPVFQQNRRAYGTPMFSNQTVMSSEPASYEDTRQLLGDQQQGTSDGARDAVPRIWHNHSPGPAQGFNRPHDGYSPSQASADIAAAMNDHYELPEANISDDEVADTVNDRDEWVTEPSASNRNSAMPDASNRNSALQDERRESNVLFRHGPWPINLFPPPPPPRVMREKYSTHELSPEPHDGFEQSSGRWGQNNVDIEMGQRSPASARTRNSARRSVLGQTGLRPITLIPVIPHLTPKGLTVDDETRVRVIVVVNLCVFFMPFFPLMMAVGAYDHWVPISKVQKKKGYIAAAVGGTVWAAGIAVLFTYLIMQGLL